MTLTRIQDDHVAHVAGHRARWTEEGWSARFAVPYRPGDTGYGTAVSSRPCRRPPAADRIPRRGVPGTPSLRAGPDRGTAGPGRRQRWNPPVTLGVPARHVVLRRSAARGPGGVPARPGRQGWAAAESEPARPGAGPGIRQARTANPAPVDGQRERPDLGHHGCSGSPPPSRTGPAPAGVRTGQLLPVTVPVIRGSIR